MCVVQLFTSSAILLSFVECSSIITRSMIRMPENTSASSSGTQFSDVSPPEPAILVSKMENPKYEIIYPFKHNENRLEEVKSRSLESDSANIHPETVSSYSSSQLVRGSRLLNAESKDNKTVNGFSSYVKNDIPSDVKSQKEEKSKNTPLNDDANLSSKEISSKYWGQYKNFSHDFFNNSDQSHTDPAIDKGFPVFDIWLVIQRMYYCVWSFGLLPCLQERFSVTTTSESFSYLQFLTPRLPRLEYEADLTEGFESRNEKYDFPPSGQDEGRRKLSKTLQFILPILMFLKMTMLPALAMMALVSGKAFLMSLLSLGAALVAASINPPGLSANKRHEIASKPPIPNNHPHDNYYYMM